MFISFVLKQEVAMVSQMTLSLPSFCPSPCTQHLAHLHFKNLKTTQQSVPLPRTPSQLTTSEHFRNATVISWMLGLLVCVCPFCAWYPRRPVKGRGSPGMRVINGYKLPCECSSQVLVFLKRGNYSTTEPPLLANRDYHLLSGMLMFHLPLWIWFLAGWGGARF